MALRDTIRVLYSFPHKIGAGRICLVAWQQVKGVADAGADVTVFPGVLHRPLPPNIKVQTTLSRGKARIPYTILGNKRALALHDWIVARRIKNLVGKVDLIHTWPLGALKTLQTAAKLGIATVLERPNAHTTFAYEVVKQECERLGITMPQGHEHDYDQRVIDREEAEYKLADCLLCPSDFVMHTFLERGFPPEKLMRHQYGFDSEVCYANPISTDKKQGLTMLFAGGCAPRKGLHYALEAWLRSPAHQDGTFLIVGDFIPGYAEKLGSMLAHPSVQCLGYRTDLPKLMRQSDLFVLSSIEEGSALVTSDARASGCVLLVSEAAGAICTHMENALVHRVGDVNTLAKHITMLDQDRELLARLRAASLSNVHEITWTAAGLRLFHAYRDVLLRKEKRKPSSTVGA